MQTILIEGVKYIHLEEGELDKLDQVLPSSNIMSNGEITKPISVVTQHWAGSSYSGYSHHYQINICFDPVENKCFALIADKDTFLLSYIHSHTWRENTGNIGISYIAMYDVKKYPVTDSMMKFAGKVLAVVCKKYNLDPNKQIKDHKYFAVKDGYPSERWDNQLMLDNKETVSSRTVRYTKEALLNTSPVIEEVPVHNPQTKTTFLDVYQEQWFSKAVLALYDLKVIAGYKESGNLFYKPFVNLTREFAFVILAQAIKVFFSKKNKQLPVVSLSTIPVELSSSPYKDDILFLMGFGLVKGDTTGSLNLDKELTRAELATLLNELVNSIGDFYVSTSISPYSCNYLDVPTSFWGFSAITKVSEMSLMIGYKEDTGHYFKPNAPITRAEFAASIYKFFSFFKKQGAF